MLRNDLCLTCSNMYRSKPPPHLTRQRAAYFFEVDYLQPNTRGAGTRTFPLIAHEIPVPFNPQYQSAPDMIQRMN